MVVYVWEVAEMEEGRGGCTGMYVPREVGRMAVASHTAAGSLDDTAVLWFWLEWKCNQAGEKKKRRGALVSSKITGRCPLSLGEGWLPSAFPSFLPWGLGAGRRLGAAQLLPSHDMRGRLAALLLLGPPGNAF